MEVADVIRSHQIGYGYQAGNAEDLYEKILAATRDRSRLTSAALRCQQLSREYSIENQYAGFAAFIARKAGQGSSGNSRESLQ
jgi:hypothetical protein